MNGWVMNRRLTLPMKAKSAGLSQGAPHTFSRQNPRVFFSPFEVQTKAEFGLVSRTGTIRFGTDEELQGGGGGAFG